MNKLQTSFDSQTETEWLDELRGITQLLSPYRKITVKNCMGINVTDEIVDIYNELTKFWTTVYLCFVPGQVLINILQPINLVVADEILQNNFVLYIVAVASFTSRWSSFYQYRDLGMVAKNLILQYGHFKNVLLEYKTNPMNGSEFKILSNIFSPSEMLHLDLKDSVNVQNLHIFYTFDIYNSKVDATTLVKLSHEFTDSGSVLLFANPKRYNLFPILYTDVWDLCIRQRASHWSIENIPHYSTVQDFLQLNKNVCKYIKYILALLVVSYRRIDTDLLGNLVDCVKVPEVVHFCLFQSMKKSVHVEMYSLILYKCVNNVTEQQHLFERVILDSRKNEKNKWILNFLNNSTLIGEHMFVALMIEGISFSSVAYTFRHLKTCNLMPELIHANNLITLDIDLYMEFIILLLNNYVEKQPSVTTAHKLTDKLVSLEIEFATVTMPVALLGLDPNAIQDHIKHNADTLLNRLNMPLLYNVSQQN